MSETRKIIGTLRDDFQGDFLDEKSVNPNPLLQFEWWMKNALEKKANDPNAMTLCTANAKGVPSARIVLLRDFSEKGFVFFTNYNSRKGKEIEENPHACLLFYWPELMRQVKIDGILEKVDPAISEKYFKERPRANQISAWISPQSHAVQNKTVLDEKFRAYSLQHEGKEIPYPVFWGGYILKPFAYEFWQGQMARLHDRVFYEKNNESGEWKIGRLAP